MDIPFGRLQFAFAAKPLLIGGKAMEYYGLRKAGADIDLVVSGTDHAKLCEMYPDNIKDLYGDIGVCEFGFEIWNQICRFGYDFLRADAAEEGDYLVTSLHKLLFLKTLAIKHKKYHDDVVMIVERILAEQYAPSPEAKTSKA